jgi:hypothetical protein
MSLEQIAEMLRREAGREGQAQQTLSGGLHLTMRREGTTWHLSMGRRGVRPDPKEQAIIRRFFRVPQGIRGSYEESAGGYHLVKLTWTDEDERNPPAKKAKAEEPVQPRLM